LCFLNTSGHSFASTAILRADKYLQQVELLKLVEEGGGCTKIRPEKTGKFSVSLKTLQHHESCERLIKMKKEFSKEENKIVFLMVYFCS